MDAARSLAISVIEPNPSPIRDFPPDPDFINDVRKRGIIEPIVVRPLGGGKYQVVAGMRRYRAAKKLGLKEVLCVILDLNDTQAFFLSLAENVQREAMSAWDLANAVRIAHDDLRQSSSTVANEIHRSEGDVQLWLAISRDIRLMNHLKRTGSGFEMALALQRSISKVEALGTQGLLSREQLLRFERDVLNESKRLKVKDLERFVTNQLDPFLPGGPRQATIDEHDRDALPHDVAIAGLIAKFVKAGASVERAVPQPDLLVRFTSESARREYGCSGLWVEIDDTHPTSVEKLQRIRSLLGSEWRVMVRNLKTGKNTFYPDVAPGPKEKIQRTLSDES